MVARVLPAPVVFVARNVRGDFYSSADKRFDLYRSGDGFYWIAHDWQQGRTWRSDRAICEQWCAEMAAEYPSPL